MSELTKEQIETEKMVPFSETKQKLKARGTTAPWFGEDYNNQFSVSNFKKQITGINYLSKFYFRFPDFKENNLTGLRRTNSKLVDILDNDRLSVLNNLYFYSENITIPMRGINTDPHVYANGFRFEAPTGSNYGDGDINITMMVDYGYVIYDFFMDWMDTIHNRKTGYFNFHNRYITDIEIFQLKNENIFFPDNVNFDDMVEYAGFTAIKVSLGNCYPKSVSAIEFKHEARDERVKITVNFTYEKIDYEIPKVPHISRRNSQSLQGTGYGNFDTTVIPRSQPQSFIYNPLNSEAFAGLPYTAVSSPPMTQPEPYQVNPTVSEHFQQEEAERLGVDNPKVNAESYSAFVADNTNGLVTSSTVRDDIRKDIFNEHDEIKEILGINIPLTANQKGMLELANSDYSDAEIEELYEQNKNVMNAEKLKERQDITEQIIDRLHDEYGTTGVDDETVTLYIPTDRGMEIVEELTNPEKLKNLSFTEFFKRIEELNDPDVTPGVNNLLEALKK